MAHHHHHPAGAPHGHHHHAPEPLANVSRLLVIGATVNLLYVVVEAAYGFFYDSLALVADAGHNLSDVAGLLISLLAFWLARRRPTIHFTYGLRKSTVLASLANAALLLVAIGGILWESFHRIYVPRPVEGTTVAWVAVVGIAVNAGSAWLFHRGKEHDLNLKSAYLHLLADALVSVGVVGAGLAMRYTGWYWLDPLVGLVVAVVIAGSTWQLLTASVRLSLDGVPAGIDLADVEHHIRHVAGVRDVHHLHVWAISTTDNALTAHLVLDAALTDHQQATLRHAVRQELEHLNIRHVTLEVETAGHDCRHQTCALPHATTT